MQIAFQKSYNFKMILMKMLKNRSIYIFTFISLNVLAGCYNYSGSGAATEISEYSKAINQAKKDKHYLVMHSGVDTYRVTSIEVEKSKQQFTVQLNKVDSLYLANVNNATVAGRKLTHMYMRDSASYTLDEPHTIPLNKVARIEGR
jgi:ABC-type uncharacterized transport system YnjBCD substrate-binding protein